MSEQVIIEILANKIISGEISFEQVPDGWKDKVQVKVQEITSSDQKIVE